MIHRSYIHEGAKIGYLTLEKRVYRRRTAVLYVCRCECGKKVLKWDTAIRMCTTIPSCGCLTLSNALRTKKGTFAKDHDANRKIGPILKKILREHANFSGKYSEKYQEIAQISRYLTTRINKNPFHPDPKYRMYAAAQKVDLLSDKRIRELLKKHTKPELAKLIQAGEVK